MERKAFIIFSILIATQSTITDSASSPSSASLAEPSSTTPEATETATNSSVSPFTTSAHTANALLEIHSSETFIPELNDASSQAFKDRAKHVKDNLETIYKLKYPSFIRAHVLSFRAGSIITTTELIFNATEDVPTLNEIKNVLLIDQININILNISSYSVTVNNSAVSISPRSSTSSAFTSTASETTMPIFLEPPSDIHSTTESSTTPTGSFTTTTLTTATASQPTASTLISASSFSPASASSEFSMSKTLSTSKATSNLASSFTPTASTETSATSATPSLSAFHAAQSSTTPTTTSTTSATFTTTASPPTAASTLISASSFSTASASTVETSTTLTTISSTATSTLAASSITNTGVTTTTIGPTTTKVPSTTPKTVPELLTDLEFHSFDTFTDALNNSESQEFKNRSKLVKDQLGAVYKPKYVNFLGVIVQGFRPGSIITRTQLVFSFNQSLPSRKEIADTLLTAVESGNVTTLNIISQTISVNGSTFATTAAPSTAAASSSASKIESHLLQATGLIIIGKILRLFL